MVDYPSVLSNKNKNLPSHIKILDKILFFIYNNSIADIAQLAERSTRNAEVASSILAVSSKNKPVSCHKVRKWAVFILSIYLPKFLKSKMVHKIVHK
jgi:hypothetical protein